MSKGLLAAQVNTDDLQATSAQGSNTGESCSPMVLAPHMNSTHSLRPRSQLSHCTPARWLQIYPYKRAVPSHLHGFSSKASLESGQRLHVFFHKYLLSTWCRNISCVLPRAAPFLHRRKRLRFQPASLRPTSPALDSFLEQDHYLEAFLLSLLLTSTLSFLHLTASTRFQISTRWEGCDEFPFSFILMLVCVLVPFEDGSGDKDRKSHVFNFLFLRTCWHICIFKIVQHIRIRPAVYHICSSFCMVWQCWHIHTCSDKLGGS